MNKTPQELMEAATKLNVDTTPSTVSPSSKKRTVLHEYYGVISYMRESKKLSWPKIANFLEDNGIKRSAFSLSRFYNKKPYRIK